MVLAAEGRSTWSKGAAIPEIPVDQVPHVYYAGVANGDNGLVASFRPRAGSSTSAADIKAAPGQGLRNRRPA